ncbi:putative late blight resistance protein homolog R1A-10 isoform X1 [Salvia splendens]|uniref:putative late blight resistance protein homolog R1A-10 isoform X1 n=2 Tax=Salvia splendens TaxID=180675 RepID=UPI001C273202|nr:putative late blight resistance protein homolog R1A-10 isoform X1 [Salvia splendens]
MAYVAVLSLKHTAYDLLTNSARLSLVPSTQQILSQVCNYTALLQELLRRSNNTKRLDGFEEPIRDAAYRFQDTLEFSELESYGDEPRVDFETVITQGYVLFYVSTRHFMVELNSPVSDEEEEEADDNINGSFASTDLDDGVDQIVGHHTEFSKLRDHMLKRLRPDDMCFFSLVAESGTGRSIIANTVLEDEDQRFDCKAWVTIGAHFQQLEIVRLILYQLDNDFSEEDGDDEDERIRNYLYKALEGRRYLIVLDDMCSVEVLEYLKGSFPDQSNGSLVLLTTNKKEMIGSLQPYLGTNVIVRVGDYQYWGWWYLRQAVFGDNYRFLHPEVLEAIKKISENCGGLRLALAKTLLFLVKKDITTVEWSNIAADEEHPIFKVEDEVSEMHKIKTEMESYNWNMDNPRECLVVTLISRWMDLSVDVALIKKAINPKRYFSKMEIISLWGMAGIGKTTYAKKIIQDEEIFSNFDHSVWITLGPKYEARDILIDILVQIYPSEDKIQMKEDDEIVTNLCKELSSKRILIVIDDLWSKEPLHHLQALFPNIKGKALVTTRLREVTQWGEDDIVYKIRLLDKEESWCLLRQKVFPEGVCPPELEKAGRKIAEECDGLPLLILKVADQLLQEDKDPKFWDLVASGKETSVFAKAHDEISEALLPSYKRLPQHLKACFLYMGVFRKCCDMNIFKVNDKLMAEDFLEHIVFECLFDLESESVLLIHWNTLGSLIKSCRLHSVFWHLCNSEAAKNGFFHAINSYDDCFMENMESQRRLCIRNSTLLGFRDVHTSMESVASARSFLCVSPPHQYPVPVSFGLRLLRVLDALAIRKYQFPVEVVELLQLRYLALTCYGSLPTSISKLWKLQFLIVNRYMSTNTSSLLPVEIWDMKELRHLQIMGGHIPNPNCGASLPMLTTLWDVSARSCTREVLEMIPNLKRLGIRIELAPDGEGDSSFTYLNNISHISGLKSLKCVVVNPQFGSKTVHPPPPMFPSSLTKLTLSGFGYPWKYMSIIGKLPVEVLKLKSYAFRGPVWEINEFYFKNLKYLLIEDTDLVYWKLKVPSFTQFECLSIRHCYKLKELPIVLNLNNKVEIIDCSPFTVNWAEQMRLKVLPFQLTTQLSWIGPKVNVAAALEE